MKWAQSLIRISTFEVETLQKRLAEIVDLRVQVEVKMSLIEAEAEAEALRARTDAEAGWYLAGFREGVKLRVASFQAAESRYFALLTNFKTISATILKNSLTMKSLEQRFFTIR